LPAKIVTTRPYGAWSAPDRRLVLNAFEMSTDRVVASRRPFQSVSSTTSRTPARRHRITSA
jgi:hypothetical protein